MAPRSLSPARRIVAAIWAGRCPTVSALSAQACSVVSMSVERNRSTTETRLRRSGVFLGDDDLDRGGDEIAGHVREMRAVALFGTDQAVGHQVDVAGELVGADVVQRVELVDGRLDEAEGIEHGDVTAESLPVAARDGA